jgi:hypothetical protein
VFIADRFLKDLEKDFCNDLLTDTTGALRWLEEVNNELDQSEKSKLSSFTFDFKSLYDSLNQDLVIESLKEAMSECRPDWSSNFCNWLIELVQLSLESSVGVSVCSKTRGIDRKVVSLQEVASACNWLT